MSRADQQRRRARRRERAARRSQSHPFPRALESDGRQEPLPGQHRLLKYAITCEPLSRDESGAAALNEELGDEAAVLHGQIFDDPHAAIPRLHALLERFADAPMLLNWLATCYSSIGDKARATEIIELNYRRNPDYLFARLNLAAHLLQENKLDEVESLLEGKFDLKLLYPHRDVFHVTEFVAMADVAITYYTLRRQLPEAKALLRVMERVAPDRDTTASLRRILSYAEMAELVSQLTGSVRRHRRTC